MDTHDWNVSTIFEIRSFGASASSLLALQELLGVEILMGLQQYIFCTTLVQRYSLVDMTNGSILSLHQCGCRRQQDKSDGRKIM